MARLALSAKSAGEHPEVSRLEVKISVVKAAIGMTFPAAEQLSELRGKKERCIEKIRNTRARMQQLYEQEREQVDELEQIKDLIIELEEQLHEDGVVACGAAA